MYDLCRVQQCLDLNESLDFLDFTFLVHDVLSLNDRLLAARYDATIALQNLSNARPRDIGAVKGNKFEAFLWSEALLGRAASLSDLLGSFHERQVGDASIVETQ